MLIKNICTFVNIFQFYLQHIKHLLNSFHFFFNDIQCLLKALLPISPNIQHSDVLGTQDSTTTKVFKKKKKKSL
jgi:hypothetical protein